MTAQNPQPQAQPSATPASTEAQPAGQVQIQLEQSELDMALKLTSDKDAALKEVGMRFLSAMEASKNYAGLLAGEQQYLQSIVEKYELPQNSYLTFGVDGTLTARVPTPAPTMPPIDQPPAANEEPSGESAG